jgi:hypothetical protein
LAEATIGSPDLAAIITTRTGDWRNGYAIFT